MKPRRARQLLIAASLLALLAALCACWVIPYRLRFQGQGCEYTFGYVGDEYNYAQQMQPFLPGATAANPVNGFGDKRIVSPFLVVDICRLLLTVTGMEITTFVWTWRLAAPVALAAVLFWQARAAVPARRKFWALPLALALTAAALPALYCVYDLVTVFPPLQGFLNRVPTNIEYLLAVALACALLLFLQRPAIRSGVLLALLSAALVYLRPLAVLPWSLTVMGCVLFPVLRRETPLRVLAVVGGLFLAVLLPWFLIVLHNDSVPIYRQMMLRWFPPAPYVVHPRWPLFICLAALLGVAAGFLGSWRRWVAVVSAAVMLALPFLPGLMSQSVQLTLFDRFGCYYLVVLVCVAMLGIGQYAQRWCGRRALASVTRTLACLIVLSFGCAAALFARNLTYDFGAHGGPYPYAVQELQYAQAYRWVAENTPANSLFLLDDGRDWSQAPLDDATLQEWQRDMMIEEDLFPIIARRRRVYTNWLFTWGVSNQELQDLALLQRGTFGFRGTAIWKFEAGTYKTVLKKYLPQYIFWRKTAPIPRGFASNLQPLSEVVYSDPVCQIWKLDYRKPPAEHVAP